MEVDEDPKQDLGGWSGDRWSIPAEHVGDLACIVANAELMQALAQRLEPLGVGQVDPSH